MGLDPKLGLKAKKTFLKPKVLNNPNFCFRADPGPSRDGLCDTPHLPGNIKNRLQGYSFCYLPVLSPPAAALSHRWQRSPEEMGLHSAVPCDCAIPACEKNECLCNHINSTELSLRSCRIPSFLTSFRHSRALTHTRSLISCFLDCLPHPVLFWFHPVASIVVSNGLLHLARCCRRTAKNEAC